MIRNGLPGQQEEQDIGQMLANPDGIERQAIEPASITEAKRMDILDVTDRLSNQTTVQAKGKESFGQRVGNFVGKADNFLGNPDTIRALAAFGTAFSRGDPGSPGTILGQFAAGQADQIESQAERKILSRLLAGEDLEDIPEEELSKLGVEGLQRVEDIRSGRAGEDLQERQIAQADRAMNLREEGLNIDRAGLAVREGSLALNESQFEHRAEVERSRLSIESDIADSLISLREAQIESLGKEDSGGAASENVLLRTNEMINSMSKLLPEVSKQKQFAEQNLEDIINQFPEETQRPGLRETAEASGANPFAFLNRAIFGTSTPIDIQNLPPGLRADYDKAKGTLESLEMEETRITEGLRQLQQVQQARLGAQLGSEGIDTSTQAATGEETSETPTQQTGAPRVITDPNDIDSLEPGTRFTVDNAAYGGAVYELTDQGTVRVVEDN